MIVAKLGIPASNAYFVGSAAAAAAYTAQGVTFDGVNDFMTTTALSGIVDGQKGIISF